MGMGMGMAIIDTASGKQWLHRANERFLISSTFKALAGGAVLAQVEYLPAFEVAQALFYMPPAL